MKEKWLKTFHLSFVQKNKEPKEIFRQWGIKIDNKGKVLCYEEKFGRCRIGRETYIRNKSKKLI